MLTPALSQTVQLVTVAVAITSCGVAIVAAAMARAARQTTRHLESTRRQREYAEWGIALTPRLHAELGAPADGISPGLRSTMIELLVVSSSTRMRAGGHPIPR